jgi:hypothetical protein
MQDLIERLERAIGPDRELDARIHAAVSWACRPEATFAFYPASSSYDVHLGDARATDQASETYTETIDAALTLLPNGWRWHVDCRPGAQCWHGLQSVFDDDGDSLAATPAIALCIAALRARAKLQQQAA